MCEDLLKVTIVTVCEDSLKVTIVTVCEDLLKVTDVLICIVITGGYLRSYSNPAGTQISIRPEQVYSSSTKTESVKTEYLIQIRFLLLPRQSL